MPETHNAKRRFIFETTQRVEVPINEDKFGEYLVDYEGDETSMLRGLEEEIYSGEVTVPVLSEALAADPEFDRLGEYSIDIQVEVRCEQHDTWHSPDHGCVYCRRPELWERTLAIREEARSHAKRA